MMRVGKVLIRVVGTAVSLTGSQRPKPTRKLLAMEKFVSVSMSKQLSGGVEPDCGTRDSRGSTGSSLLVDRKRVTKGGLSSSPFIQGVEVGTDFL